MNEFSDRIDPHFLQLIISLQAGAMQQMGKVASPITGKVERNLSAAKSAIDMLNMLKEKTQSNCSEDEKRLIDHILYELRLNYVDETKKKDAEPQEQASARSDQASSAEETTETKETAPAEKPEEMPKEAGEKKAGEAKKESGKTSEDESKPGQ